jgi:molybdopterin-guanine dinucleotide biosynthesis protein MobB
MLPIISFVGRSESGKTTLLSGIIANLKARGYRIAVIKHTQEFELEKEGTSSWNLGQAGADSVVISSPEELAIMKKTDHDFTPQEITRLIDGDYDLILTEGFKKSSTMKIEVHRKEQGSGLLLVPENQLLAVVTNEPLDVSVPQFDRDDIKGLADFIANWLSEQPKEETELFVNDSFIPLNLFVKGFVTRTVSGMVSSLKGSGEIKNLRLTIRRKS